MKRFYFTSVLLIFGLSLLSLGAEGSAINPDRTVIYKKTQKTALKLHVFMPPGHISSGKVPVVIFFFGGGWTQGVPTQFYQHARDFAKLGIVAISAEYRTKKSHGTTPFECVKDGKSAIRWLRMHADELGINANQIIAAGGSAGGHVAACTGIIKGHEEVGEDLTVSSVPNAMILYNPVLDTTENGYGMSKVGEKRKTAISPCHNIRKDIPPTLIFHGTADRTVPFENAQRFRRLMLKAGNICELVSFEGRGHGFFNGSYFRPKNQNIDFNATMESSVKFLSTLGYQIVKQDSAVNADKSRD